MARHSGAAFLATFSLMSLQTTLVGAVPFGSIFSSLARRITYDGGAGVAPIGQFGYLGCFAEPHGIRALPAVIGNDGMTREMCASFCPGSKYFGVEYGRECWCGNELHENTQRLSEEQCSSPCAGNALQVCGGGSKLNIYVNPTWTPPLPQQPGPIENEPPTPVNVGTFEYQGCYTDPMAPRALSVLYASNDMTPQLCAQRCAGRKWIGIEYGRECWCGNDLIGSTLVSQSECSFPCTGDATQKCGAGGRMSLYLNTAYSGPTTPTTPETPPGTPPSPPVPGSTTRIGDYISEGCWTDDGDRTLPELYANDGMTLEMCAQHAAARGYQYFGVEWARECWMGNSLRGGSAAADTSTCNKPCGGDGTQTCGGGKRLSLYKYSPAPTEPETPDSETTLDFDDAELNNVEIIMEGGTPVARCNPPPGGSASIEFPDGSVTTPDTTDPCVVDLTYRTEPGTSSTSITTTMTIFGKRAELTQCFLTIMVGPQIIYSAPIMSTDGTFTTVTTLAVAPGVLTSLIVTQYCPTTSIPIIIQPPVIRPDLDAPLAPEPSVYSTTSTPASSITPSPSTDLTTSYPASTTYVPPTATSVPATTAIPTFAAPDVPTLACDFRSGAFTTPGCQASGWPVQTSGLLAVATGIPEFEYSVEWSFEQRISRCAVACRDFPGCNSYNLYGLTDPFDEVDLVCYLYSGTVADYIAIALQSPERDYEAVWFRPDCLACPGLSTTASMTEAPTLAPTSTTGSTSSAPTTTTTTDIPTFLAPQVPTGACNYRSGAFNTPGCEASGPPLQYSGLLAVATGIPERENLAGSFQQRVARCAAACDSFPGCKSYNLHGLTSMSDGNDLVCYLFSGIAGEYITMGNGSPRDYDSVWFRPDCLACPGLSSTTSATAPTTTAPTTSSTTSTTASTSSFPTTSATTVPTFSAPQVPTSACDFRPSAFATPGCQASGPRLQYSGLLAVATGIPERENVAGSFQQRVARCAAACNSVPGCKSYNLYGLTNMWDGNDLLCYLFSGTADTYMAMGIGQSPDYEAVWFRDDCLACPGLSTTTTATSTTSTITSPTAPPSTTSATTPTTTASATSGPTTTTAMSTTSSTVSQLLSSVPGVPTYTAATIPAQGCNYNGIPSVCRNSRLPTPTTGLIAVATGIPGATDLSSDEPASRCANMCDGLLNCASFAIDRSDISNWKCLFYTQNYRTVYSSVFAGADDAWDALVWYDAACHTCLWAKTWPDPASLPAGTTTTTAPAATGTARPVCTRVADPPEDMTCSIRGLYGAYGPDHSATLFSQADCAVFCSFLKRRNNTFCKSYQWNANTKDCRVWDRRTTWEVILEGTQGGPAYRNVWVEDGGCWTCPDNVLLDFDGVGGTSFETFMRGWGKRGIEINGTVS